MKKIVLDDIEKEILTYYAQGYTFKRIAKFIGLNRYKIDKCFNNLYFKFGTNKKIVILISAIKKKLIDINAIA